MPRPKLPQWLSLSEGHLAEQNMRHLRKAMQESFVFTENESLKLLLAIEEAAGGDPNKVAGAAEFCAMLLETMEMGLNALVAAAFHFCSCVTARERPVWTLPTVQLDSYGAKAGAIVEDAARLKKLEMVAHQQFGSVQSRVRPDTKDAENLRKLLLSSTQDWRALAIRSCACLYRLRGILKVIDHRDSRENQRVAREALSIYVPLASRLGLHRLKNEMEGAAFQILYPRQYAKVNEYTGNGLKVQMDEVLNQIQHDIALMLQQDGEFVSLVKDFSVSARVKEPYSLWRKMLKHGYKHILQVPDALALRIIVDAKKLKSDEPDEITRAREKALCYYAQRLCTERYLPVPQDPRFKDYIQSPKQNGYQSLHYTAKIDHQGEQWTCEFQVRSGEMHQVAEFGLASHWTYKLPKASVIVQRDDDQLQDSSVASYLRNVQEWKQHGDANLNQWDATLTSSETLSGSDIWQSRRRVDRIRERNNRLKPYLQALAEAQLDLTRESVFVFVNGKVTTLPAGACVLDALRFDNGHDSALVNLNGSSASVTQFLQNGDVLTWQAETVMA